MPRSIVLSREELYERVWQAPMLKFASELGVSDVAIGKACRRLKVPVPGRGYWVKVDDQRVKQPLPALAEGDILEVSFTAVPKHLRCGPDAIGIAEMPPVSVNKVLTEPHRLVRSTVQSSKPADVFAGRLVLKGDGALDARVSPNGFGHAMRLYDAIIKASEGIGCTWSVVAGKTLVTYNGHAIDVVLKEFLRKQPAPPAPPPKAVRGRTEPNWAAMLGPRHIWESTGEYEFLVDAYGPRGAKRRWRGTVAKPLDLVLTELVIALPVLAALAKAHRKALDDQSKAIEARRNRRIADARAKEKGRQLRLRLIDSAARYEQANAIRRLCQEIDRRLAEGVYQHPEGMQAWVEWAKAQAEDHDPLAGGLADLTNMEVTVPRSFDEGVRESLWDENE